MSDGLPESEFPTNDELTAGNMLRRLSVGDDSYDLTSTINPYPPLQGSIPPSPHHLRHNNPPSIQNPSNVHPAQVAEAGYRVITDAYSPSVRRGAGQSSFPVRTGEAVFQGPAHGQQPAFEGTGRFGYYPQEEGYGGEMMVPGYNPHMGDANAQGQSYHSELQPGGRGSIQYGEHRFFHPSHSPMGSGSAPLQIPSHPEQPPSQSHAMPTISTRGRGRGAGRSRSRSRSRGPGRGHGRGRGRGSLAEYQRSPSQYPIGGLGHGQISFPVPFLLGPANSPNYPPYNYPPTQIQQTPPQDDRRLTKEEAALVLLDLAGPYKRVVTPDPFRATWGQLPPTEPADTENPALVAVSPRGTDYNEYPDIVSDHLAYTLRRRSSQGAALTPYGSKDEGSPLQVQQQGQPFPLAIDLELHG